MTRIVELLCDYTSKTWAPLAVREINAQISAQKLLLGSLGMSPTDAGLPQAALTEAVQLFERAVSHPEVAAQQWPTFPPQQPLATAGNDEDDDDDDEEYGGVAVPISGLDALSNAATQPKVRDDAWFFTLQPLAHLCDTLAVHVLGWRSQPQAGIVQLHAKVHACGAISQVGLVFVAVPDGIALDLQGTNRVRRQSDSAEHRWRVVERDARMEREQGRCRELVARLSGAHKSRHLVYRFDRLAQPPKAADGAAPIPQARKRDRYHVAALGRPSSCSSVHSGQHSKKIRGDDSRARSDQPREQPPASNHQACANASERSYNRSHRSVSQRSAASVLGGGDLCGGQ